MNEIPKHILAARLQGRRRSNRRAAKNARLELRDAYIKHLLLKGPYKKPSDVPRRLIELKRKEMLLKRQIERHLKPGRK
jgi:hypothetical protein